MTDERRIGKGDLFKVVVNHEEQYSIWPAHRENARGWKDTDQVGTREECLAYVKRVGGTLIPDER